MSGKEAAQRKAQALLEQAKNGDRDAYGTLYEMYFVPVFRYIYARVRDKEVSSDLTQTVFVKVYQALDRFQYQKVSPLAYFFTVARNTVIDYWRKDNRDMRVDDAEAVLKQLPDTAPSPAEVVEQDALQALVERGVQQLTQEQQDVVILRFTNGLSTKEVANIVGKSDVAVRQLQTRALKALRAYIAEHTHRTT